RSVRHSYPARHQLTDPAGMKTRRPLSRRDCWQDSGPRKRLVPVRPGRRSPLPVPTAQRDVRRIYLRFCAIVWLRSLTALRTFERGALTAPRISSQPPPSTVVSSPPCTSLHGKGGVWWMVWRVVVMLHTPWG